MEPTEETGAYQAPRDGAASRRMAAHFNNAQAVNGRADRSRPPSAKGGSMPAYEEWTRDALYQRAQDLGIEGRSAMSKDELVDVLRRT
ncbi:MAG: Rho termination factor [Hoeflea sp.]|nr:Rho termination factor [Hoeflea sp.]